MKKLTVILLSILVTLSVVACQDSENGDSSSTASNPVVASSDRNQSSDSSDSSSSNRRPDSKPNSSVVDSSIAGPSSTHSTSRPDDEVKVEPDPDDEASIHADHYCYSKLTERQKEYYEVMHDAVHDMQTYWIALGKADKTYKTDVAVVRNALANDHPDIFWLPSYYATALGNDSEGGVTALIYFSTSPDSDPSYLMSRSEMSASKKKLDSAVKNITDKVTATDPYDIELQLHDLLCETVSYSADPDDPMIYTAYGALVNKKALCEGYTRAMQLLLAKFGIQSVTVTGVAGNEGHMWNVVNIHGEWYHLDVTWNDTKVGSISHEYFNINDKDILADHTFNKNYDEFGEGELQDGTVSFNIFRPVCNGTEYNYFNRSGFVFFSDGIDTLADYLTRQSSKTIEVRFSDSGFREKFYADSDQYLNIINDTLEKEYPDCGFYIGGISVSSSVLILYKKTVINDHFS